MMLRLNQRRVVTMIHLVVQAVAAKSQPTMIHSVETKFHWYQRHLVVG
jgi:hypothetical protein